MAASETLARRSVAVILGEREAGDTKNQSWPLKVANEETVETDQRRIVLETALRSMMESFAVASFQ